MKDLSIYGFTILPWIYISLAYLFWVQGLFILKKIASSYIKKISVKTHHQWDDLFIKSANFPLNLLIIASGGFIVRRMIPEDPSIGWASYFLMGFKAIMIISIVAFLDQFVCGVIKIYSGRVEILRTSGGIANVLVRLLVVCIGALVLLDSFGISVTPVLASLGIGSLAVALALQPTLENFFSGIQIITDKPIQIGHFIKLESGEEGYVYKIGWRSTWIQIPENNMVVIPNKNLVNAKVINYYYPNPGMAFLVQMGVHYNSDLKKVERVVVEVAIAVLSDPSFGVKDFEPKVRFHTFGEFSINFVVVLWAKEIGDCGLIKHEFIKRLHERFLKEGIVIPYPIRTINYEQEKVSV